MASRTGLLPATSKVDNRLQATSSTSSLGRGKHNIVKSLAASENGRTGHMVQQRQQCSAVDRRSTATKERSSQQGTQTMPGVKRSASCRTTKGGAATTRIVTKKSFNHGPGKEQRVQTFNTPGRTSSVKKSPKRSILKNVGPCGATDWRDQNKEVKDDHRHVTFKNKNTEQASLRAKLNAWLEAKGKTPSKCRHLMVFDAEMSAKRKKDKLVDRKLSRDLLSGQNKILENEDIRKKLFKDVKTDTITRVKMDTEEYTRVKMDAKENTRVTMDAKENVNPREEESHFGPVTAQDSASTLTNDDGRVQFCEAPPAHSDSFQALPSDEMDVEEAISSRLNTMLNECLNIFYAGCPLDNVLPWLAEMETHIPKAASFAPFYIVKAKVLAAFPDQVVDVFCQAVLNNAAPYDLLANEMRNCLSPLVHASLPRPDATTSMSVPSCLPDYTLQREYTCLNQQINSPCDSPLSHNSTPISTPVVSDCKRPTAHVVDAGSTVKFVVDSATPLLSKTPETASVAVVTPVRRSFRLSGRQSTPGARKEMDNISHLSEDEKRSMIFRPNLALNGE